MPRDYDRLNSVLIVSGSEKFDAVVRKALSGGRYAAVDVRRNAAAARRCVLERSYDIIVINCPLTDEFGHDFAIDAAEKTSASVLLVVPAEIYDEVLLNVTDYGILAVSKADPQGRIDRAVHFLLALRKRMQRLEQQILTVNEKMEELRLVSKAKILLIEKKNMTEDEAHRFIGKQAMNRGVSRKKIAGMILEDLE